MTSIASQSTSLADTAGAMSLRRALALLWLLSAWFVVTVVVGRAWDAAWHVRHIFETFWSPPHLFIYTACTIAGLLAAALVLVPSLRRCFGGGLQVASLPFEVPGALYIVSAGFVMLGFAGLALDNVWHTRFGLDETNWSAPHAMIGWSLFVVVLGLVAARLALRGVYPLRWFTGMTLGLLVLAFSGVLLGPLGRNHTPDTLRAIAAIPALAAQPAAQHSYRIYLAWNLTRTNPLIIPLGALWAGVVLALLRGIDRRAGVLLAAVVLWTLLGALGDLRSAARLETVRPFMRTPATWLPLPILPAALALLGALRLGWSERRAGYVAGLVFGILAYLVWVNMLLALPLVLLAAPALALGMWLGRSVSRTLDTPTGLGARALPLIAVIVPLLTGAVDLYLRMRTS